MGSDRPLLVTGAGGQLARALAHVSPEAIQVSEQMLDVTDRTAVLEVVVGQRPGVIINTAAHTNVDAAESDPERAMDVNGRAVRHLAEAANQCDALLVQISTDYVFSGDKEGPYREDDKPQPLSVYGRTKLEGERAAAEARKHLIVRTSWLFGEGHNFLRTILKASEARAEVTVVDDQWGLPTYAGDLAPALLDLLDRRAQGTYHLAGGGEAATWADLGELALETAGRATKVKRVNTAEYYSRQKGPAAPRPANSVLDCSKAASLGVALRPWPEAVVAYVKETA